MTGREKVCAALAHEDAPIPIDVGGSTVTGMHVSVVEALREWYGLDRHPVKVVESYQMLGEIEEDLEVALGVDVEPMTGAMTKFGFPSTDWKEWRAPWGQVVLVPGGFVTTVDSNGDVLIYPQSDSSVSASGRMPASGYFFDSIVRQDPIVEEELRAEDNEEEFTPVNDAALEHLAAQARDLAPSDRAVLANFGGTGLGDIANVPGPQLKHPKGIRDVTEWYISTVVRQDLLHEIFSYQVDVALANFARIRGVVGDRPDVVYLCGTDFGTQDSTFCSRETFRDLYLPHYLRMTRWIHENTAWKVFKHSCGAVYDFMPLFIEAGFDVINPVQISARGMDRTRLKESFGDSIVFWGGGVDTQHTLSFGTPEDVTREVTESCRVFGRGGGYVFNAVHNVQAKSPVANVVAMFEAVHEFNRG